MKVFSLLAAAIYFLIAAGNNFSDKTEIYASIGVANLRCENLVNPLGIDLVVPKLSWQLNGSARSLKQAAWQVLVSDNQKDLDLNKGNFWDSGKVLSAETVNIPYQGKTLTERQKYYWKVKVWDAAGHASNWSEVATWEMGFLTSEAWQAKWIGTGEDAHPDTTLTGPAPFFRKEFRLPAEATSARIRVSGLGFYELSLNGSKVGDQVLAPAQTNYDLRKLQKLIYFHDDQSRQRVLYNTFDVTQMLKKGENVVGMVLGNGWYNQRDRTAEGWLWYNTPRLLFQLEITYKDGNSQVICSDQTWKTTFGPYRHDGIFTGELYDARLEPGAWNKPGYNDQGWLPATLVKAPAGKLHSQLAPPDRIIRSIHPLYQGKTESGSELFDAGEMISGWLRLKMHGNRGDTISIRYIEELGRDYHQLDTYVLKGEGEECFEPRFTWHAFRQIEISGLKYQPNAGDLLVQVVHTDVTQVGNFECSNQLFNQIYQNYLRTQLGNLHGSISSDCPHRERLGYTGDGQVAIESAILNFDMTQFYQKWFLDMEDARNHKTGYVPHTVPFGGGGGGPAWGSGYIIMPWQYFLHYGDKQVLATHYEGMKQWIGYLGTRCDTNGIVVREEPKGWCLGDWATPEKIKLSPELVNTCYYYHDVDLMSKIAASLGKQADQEQFIRLAESIKSDINRKFFNSGTGEYLDGKQGANIFPMAFGIVDLGRKAQIFDHIVKHLGENKNHFDTGILATPLLLEVLTENGRPDLAFIVMNQRDFPSYGDYIIGKNATTIWENWDGGSSHSHPMYGSVIAWFFKTVAGLAPDPANPGGQDMVINPFTNNELTFARASYNSVYGKYAVSWKKENDGLVLETEIPVNSSATIYFPSSQPQDVKENGKQIINNSDFKFLRIENGKSIFRVGSGKYHFELRN
jgi:alpha-L-rhamnosidase